ncbi:cysteine hydrolase family protein [Kibdelosporangium aridum]|uniref:cysteine hydrolase family protein n=1 Tax=Kibdelosporangium aridum TaxID=2030 RepID=UPI000A893A55
MPARSDSALVVVDMQNGFCHPEGSRPRAGRGLTGVAAAIANTALAVRRAREARVPVVFTRHVFRPGFADLGVLQTQHAPPGIGLLAGTWDAEIVDGLGFREDDLVVDKVRFDAFLWTSLDPLLRGLEVTKLVVCGVSTNFCVESTVRSAVMRDYPVTVLDDCCAGFTSRLHTIGIEVMRDCGFARMESVTAGFAFRQELGIAD